MNIEELSDVIKSIKYKPDWSIQLLGDYFQTDEDTYNESAEMYGLEIYHIHISVKHFNADKPNNLIDKSEFASNIVINEGWLALQSKDDVIKIIHERLRKMEQHECDEWFRYENVKIFDPHKKVG